MSENGEIYTAGKNFTLPPALTALTNSTSVCALAVCNVHGSYRSWNSVQGLMNLGAIGGLNSAYLPVQDLPKVVRLVR